MALRGIKIPRSSLTGVCAKENSRGCISGSRKWFQWKSCVTQSNEQKIKTNLSKDE